MRSVRSLILIGTMHQLRLRCSLFYVDVRLREFNGRWLAAADTLDGPSLGWGMSAVGAAVDGPRAVRRGHRRAAGQPVGRAGGAVLSDIGLDEQTVAGHLAQATRKLERVSALSERTRRAVSGSPPGETDLAVGGAGNAQSRFVSFSSPPLAGCWDRKLKGAFT